MFKKKEKKEPEKGEKTEVVEAPTNLENKEEAEIKERLIVGDLNTFEASVFQRLDYVAATLQEIKQEQDKIKEMIEKEINQ